MSILSRERANARLKRSLVSRGPVIDGQRYLAADTGVKGLHVDICAASHEEALAFGVQSAEVRMVEQ